MELHNLLNVLNEQGVALYLDAGRLKTKSAPGAITAAMAEQIRSHKNALIELLELNQGSKACETIPVADRTGMLPLSFSQQRMWFVEQLNDNSAQNNMPAALRLTGNVRLEVLEQTINTIVERHEILRTRYQVHNGEPVQHIQPHVPQKLLLEDISGLEPQEKMKRVDALVAQQAHQRFDLSQDPMLRVRLLKLAEQEFVITFTLHHIASDGWSMQILIDEFAKIYNAFSRNQPNPLLPLDIQYADYACWQRNARSGNLLEQQLNYWRETLAGIPQVHRLPLDRQRGQQQTFSGQRFGQILDATVLARLNTVAARHNSSLFMVIQTAFAVLLGRLSHDTDIVMGTPVAGRSHKQSESLMGLFLNTLVLRTRFDDNPTFEDLLQRNKLQHLQAHKHSDIPFEYLVEQLNPVRTLAHPPLFQILINMNKPQGGGQFVADFDVQAIQTERNHDSKYDLTLYVSDLSDRLKIEWAYNTQLFDEASITGFAEEFAALLDNLLIHPQQSVLNHPWQNGESWHKPEIVPLRSDGLIHRLIEQQALRQPTVPAVICQADQVSYQVLNERANRLAHGLMQEHAVKPGGRIGIYCDRSVERIVAILATLKCGGVFVPLSQEIPVKRLQYLVEDAGLSLIVTDAANAAQARQLSTRTTMLVMQSCELAYKNLNAANPDIPTLSADSPAHIIYTSGSTGNPKGVLGTHLATTNRVEWMLKEFPYGATEKACHITSMAFIRGIWELFTPLAAGIPMILFDRSLVRESAAFIDELQRQQVTRLVTAPSLMASMLNQMRNSGRVLPGFSHWFVSGEALPVELARQVCQLMPATRLINLYGSTEVLSDVLYADVKDYLAADKIPLGKVIDGVAAILVDRHGNPVPKGVTGELLITGACVAIGYNRLDELTDRQFVQTPAGRAYKTGDLARYNADGSIDYLGRFDHQLKIRGYRIELSEIEMQLAQLPGVKTAVVVAKPAADDLQLIAYLVLQSPETDLEQVKMLLGQILPSYMLPHVYQVLAALPYKANGKVDRSQLPEVNLLEQHHYVAPVTATERTLVELCKELLHLEGPVSMKASFFELGGHSLLATRLVSLVAQKLYKSISIKSVFEFHELQALAACIDRHGLQMAHEIQNRDRNGPALLSYSQQRLWFIDKLEGGSPQYNIPAVLRLKGTLNCNALAQNLKTILQRHESLRTVFREQDGIAIQHVKSAEDFSLVQIDLTSLTALEREAHMLSLAQFDAKQVFDLKDDYMLRAHLLKLAEEDHVLLLTMHHIASDGWSKGILIKEFVALYQAYCKDEPVVLPELLIQYADYAQWQRSTLSGEHLARELDFWKNYLKGIPKLHQLPLDKPRREKQGFVAGRHWQKVSPDILIGLNRLAREHNATLFMVLQTAFSVLLGRYSGESDIVMGVPTAGRPVPSLEPLIGFFINTLVFRTDVSAGQTFTELLKRSAGQSLELFTHQNLPFEMLVEELKPDRSMAYNPVCQIKFVLQNQHSHLAKERHELDGLAVSFLDNGVEYIRFDLDLTAHETSQGLVLSWSYKEELFEHDSIKRMADSFAFLLCQLVESPSRQLREYALLPVEQERWLLDVSTGAVAARPELSVLSLIEAQAEKTPAQIAVRCGDICLSYAELNQRANRLANAMMDQGVAVGDVIALCTDRSAEFMVGILAALKAGAVYIPLEPSLSKERIQFILQDSGVEWAFVQSCYADKLARYGVDIFLLDGAADQTNWLSEYENVKPQRPPAKHAYIIYTSGSTGQPKGVEITQAGLLDYCLFARNHYYDAGVQGSFVVTSHGFDITVPSLYVPLLSGDPVTLAAPGNELQQLLSRLGERVDGLLLRMTPAHVKVLLALSEDYAPYSHPHVFVIGGESFPLDLARALQAKFPNATVYNHYGPTESVVGVAIFNFTANQALLTDVLPIGSPMENTQLFVLDAQRQLCPVGVKGELYIGGNGLASGYVDQPLLTQEKFISCEIDGVIRRLYRSGDYVRRQSDGHLVYLGRCDDQVKLRGYRIELGEIDTLLRSHPDVLDVVTVIHEEETSQLLVSYLVSERDEVILFDELSHFLRHKLPEYMLPSAYVILEALPLSANGKLDKQALPAPSQHRKANYAEPVTETERKLADIWQLILKTEKVGLDDNFFATGGDSILSIQLVAMANRQGLSFSVQQLFFHQTIRSLAQQISSQKENLVSQELVMGSQILLPKTRLFLEKCDASLHYNQTLLLTVNQPLEQAFLHDLVKALYLRHDALRLGFTKTDREWAATYQPLNEEMIAQSCIIDTFGEYDSVLIESVCERYQHSVDVIQGPLFRLVYMVGADWRRIFILCHHLIVDGVSWRILLDDIEQAFEHYQQNGCVKLAAKTSSLQEWGLRLLDYSRSAQLQKERQYWLGQYDEYRIAPIPQDLYPQDIPLLSSTRRVSLMLSEQETACLIRQCPAVYRTQINELLLAGVYNGIRRWRGVNGIRILLEGHGREALFDGMDTTQTLGWFTSIYPLVLCSQSDSVDETIKSVKEQYRKVPQHGIGYGILRYIGQDVELTDTEASAPASVLFNYMGQLDQSLTQQCAFRQANEKTGHNIHPGHRRQHLLGLNSSVLGGMLRIVIDFSQQQYHTASIEDLADNIRQGLLEVIATCMAVKTGSYTPSDFPLAAISRERLDELLCNYPQLEKLYPATPMQEGMYFHASLDNSAYVNQTYPVFRGSLDLTCFETAWRQVCQRHDALRTLFAHTEQGLHQVVLSEVILPWRYIDLTGEPDRQLQIFEDYRRQDKQIGFDLSNAPLMRISMFKLSEDRHLMLWTHHHLILDGWCKPLVYRDVMQRYHALRSGIKTGLPKAPVYESYLRWLGSQDQQQARDYWKSYLGDVAEGPTPLGLYQPQAAETHSTKLMTSGLSKEQTERLVRFARANNTTVNTVLQLAWGYLLCRYSDRDDVIFGSTISGRPAQVPQIDDMVGMFINTIPVKISFGAGATVTGLLGQLHRDFNQSQEFGYLSLTDIKNQTAIPAEIPLFYSSMVFENYPLDAAMDVAKTRTTTPIMTLESKGSSQQTNFPLFISASLKDELEIACSYATAQLSGQTANRVLEHLVNILLSMMDGTDLSEIRLLAEHEEEQLLSWNRSAVEYPDTLCLHELFELQAGKHPQRIAIVCGGQQMSYAELNRRSNQLAHHLKTLAVRPDELVAVVTERKIELVVSLLAILKSGAAYVAIDPEYPQQRIEYMLQDSAARILLLSSTVLHTKPYLQHAAEQRILVDGEQLWTTQATDNIPTAQIGLHNRHLAYAVYTSGTTGKPKGVLIEHQGLVNLITQDIKNLQINETSRSLHTLSVGFDAATEHLFNVLCAGGSVHLIEPTEMNMGYVTRLDITHLALPTSVLEVQAELETPGLKYIVVGGQSINQRLVDKWVGKVTLVNQYGPSEACITATQKFFTHSDQTLSIGSVVANKQAFVVDKQGRLCPAGVEGELVLGGIGIARGYLNQPELTARQFVELPLPGIGAGRYYKTGDRACVLPNGELVFRGRRDQQMKLRGYRIEPEEIESVLQEDPAVVQSHVVIQGDSAGQMLVAYVVLSSEFATLCPAELQEQLTKHAAKTLPGYMLPTVYMVLDQLPVNTNGKIDKAQLPKPESRPERQIELPRNMLDSLLIRVWSAQLKREVASIGQNLHEAGANSLMFMAVRAQLERHGYQTGIRALLESQSIKNFVDGYQTSHERSGQYLEDAYIRLNQHQGNTHLFVIHPYGGNVSCYQALARELAAICPVAGIVAPFNYGYQLEFASLDVLAAYYLRIVKHVQPVGPYRIAGWSAGGTLAYLLAQQLTEQGDRVEYIGMIDSPPPGVQAAVKTDVEYLLSAAGHADPQIATKVDMAIFGLDFEQALEQVCQTLLQGAEDILVSHQQLKSALRFAVNYSKANAGAIARKLEAQQETVLYVAAAETKRPLAVEQVEKHFTGTLTKIQIDSNHIRILEDAGLLTIVHDMKHRFGKLELNTEFSDIQYTETTHGK